MMPGTESIRPKIVLICLALVLLVGSFLRLPPALFARESGALRSIAVLHPNPKWYELGKLGPDEKLYRGYIEQLNEKGPARYPEIVRGYIDKQTALPDSILPPTRFLFIFAGYLWSLLSHNDALESLRNVSSLFSILTLALSAILAWRLRASFPAVALVALVAFAPTQLHMSQHALVDGFFSFWALLSIWLLWENLNAPRQWRWLVAYTACLSIVVLTKENAFFVWIAIVIILIVNRWLQYGRVTPELVVATFAGPLLGVITLMILAGGPVVLLDTYRLLATKNSVLAYAIATGDGPWHRYLVDLLLVSPIVLLLAIGAAFQIDRTKRPELFLLMFIGGSYLVMCNVKYGMNLRYANMWDVPLRFLALSTLVGITAPLRHRRNLAFVLAVVSICTFELLQYYTLFVQYPLHELATNGILRALSILK